VSQSSNAFDDWDTEKKIKNFSVCALAAVTFSDSTGQTQKKKIAAPPQRIQFGNSNFLGINSN